MPAKKTKPTTPPVKTPTQYAKSERLVVYSVPVGDLILDPNNAREHNPENLADIRRSYEKFEQQKPIVAGKDMVVIAGNGQLTVARERGEPTIDVVFSDLTGDDAMAYAISDNATGLSSDWIYKRVAETITELKSRNYDLKATGLSNATLENLLAAKFTPPAVDPTEFGVHSHPEMAPPIRQTKEQRQTIDLGIARMRAIAGQLDMSEGRALELLVADWLAGAPSEQSMGEV